MELASLRDKFSALHVEETRLRRELDLERAAFEKEKHRLVKQSEATITALQEEKEKSLVHAHQELRDKIAELNEKMQGSIRKIRDADSEALRHEMEGQRLRSLSELQKKCQAAARLNRGGEHPERVPEPRAPDLGGSDPARTSAQRTRVAARKAGACFEK